MASHYITAFRKVSVELPTCLKLKATKLNVLTINCERIGKVSVKGGSNKEAIP